MAQTIRNSGVLTAISPVQRVFAALFLTALLAGGALIGKALVDALVGTYQARSYVEAPAKLLMWSNDRVSGPRSTHGSSVLLSDVKASYEVSYSGRTWVSERVGMTTFRDTMSSALTNDIQRKFMDAQAHDGAMTVWVDPDRPGVSVVERRLPLAFCLFSALFLAFPCGLVTLTGLSWLVGRCFGAGSRMIRQGVLPLWGILHSLPAVPIALLASPQDVGLGSVLMLIVLVVPGLLGVRKLLALRRQLA